MNVRKNESRLAVVAAGLLLVAAACSAPGSDETAETNPAQDVTGVTVFEGARVIVGDGGPPIENATFVVRDDRFVQVGRTGEVDVPEGAASVDLTGRTVMPALIDTHTHLGRTREDLIDDLQRKAYYGVGVAMSLGQDTGDLPYQVREETNPNAARYRTAGRGLTRPEPGRTDPPTGSTPKRKPDRPCKSSPSWTSTSSRSGWTIGTERMSN